MLKIRKVAIENFRGLKLRIELDFYKAKNPTSVLIYGRNGTGKSSIVDGWEWFNNFEIKSLSREGVSNSDYPHKSSGGKNSYISVDFEHPIIKNATVTFNEKKIKAPTVTGQHTEFKKLNTYPNYLRYSDLQEFVYKSKTERYRYIAKFFGLEEFLLLQDTLYATTNKITITLQGFQNSLNGNINEICFITGETIVNETKVLDFINSVGVKHGISPILHFKEVDDLKTALEKIISENPVALELSEWKSFQKKQNLFYPIVTTKQSCLDVELKFKNIKENEDKITQLILSDLYERSIEVIPKLKNKSVCPVCDNTFEGDLFDHVSKKHLALESLNKEKKEFDTKKNLLEKQFTSITNKVGGIVNETNTDILKELSTFFEDLNIINKNLPGISEKLKKQLKELDDLSISSDECIDNIDLIIKNEISDKSKVQDKIDKLSKDEKTLALAQDFTNVSNIITAVKNFSINNKKVDYLKEISENLTIFFTSLTSYIQTTIQTTFTTISTDVVDYFNYLESSNPFIKNPELKLISGKDKAVELEIEFVSEKITPAFKFLSESQVNSFGLSIFLAAVKHFNFNFKFFILDDVVNSFDSFKRPKVSQLLATRFKDFQILMVTHDQIFFDTVQRDFPNWNRYKFTSWDYTAGPRFKLSKNYSEEIQEFLDEDKPLLAGYSLGRYLEWTFGVLNENLQTPMKYKLDNTYTLSEFYDPLLKRLKDKLKLAGKKHSLIVKFEEFEQGTIFRNYCAHWKNEANPFTTPEIDSIFKKWLEIENMMFCTDCKSFISLSSHTTPEYIKCSCGKLDLNDAKYFV